MSEVDYELMMKYHPCFSDDAHNKAGRIHLPVAPDCNIKCNYCDLKVGERHKGYRPALSRKIISPQDALNLVTKYSKLNGFTVAGISGPGEPLYNEATFETFELVHRYHPRMNLCLCTNGLLLPANLDRLIALGVNSVSITINAISSEVAARIYSFVSIGKCKYIGKDGARLLIERQWKGLKMAAFRGLPVKVNTILIPGINDREIVRIARKARVDGAFKQNVVPLIPLSRFKHYQSPTNQEIGQLQKLCEQIIPQFKNCKQCRADSIGIPGREQFCKE